jgi:hypothetical protein
MTLSSIRWGDCAHHVEEGGSMTMLLGPLLAVMVLAQASADRTVAGEVVDEQGKPIADVPVVFYVAPNVTGKEYQAEAKTSTDAGGQFRLKLPPLGRTYAGDMNFLAYRPGSALTATAYFARLTYRLVLRKAEPRTIQVVGSDGKPVAGARIAPLIFDVFSGATAEIPASMAGPLAVTTGPDGRAALNYLAARDQLVAVRVTADAIGTQDFLLVEQPGRGSVEPVITIRLKKTSRLAGRVVDGSGQPVAGQVVEIWSKAKGNWVRSNTVELRGGPLKTAVDGRFQTPDNLLVGSSYRVVVRGPGKEPILSDWIEIGEAPRTLLPLRLRPLRRLSGRVVDRQGRPVADVEVFQSSDGPEPTSTRTGPDGRFVLDGFRQGPVFVFARGEGFRFHGQLIKEGQSEVTVELTRLSERPARAMRMITDPVIPLEESRAMARRLVEPLWKVVVEKGDDRTKYETLRALVDADPAGVLDKLESARFASKVWEFRIQNLIAVALVDTDPEEAGSIAESIADPRHRAAALIAAAEALPDAQRVRKLALLDRAALHARAAPDADDRLWQVGDAAEAFYHLGEVERARALFAEGLRLANQMTEKTTYRRAAFASQLAAVDAPGALGIAKEFRGARVGGASKVVLPIRYLDPAECVRFWKDMGGRLSSGTWGSMFEKLATVDPARARRVIEKMAGMGQLPEVPFSLALAEKDRDASAAGRLFAEGLQLIDQRMKERPEQLQSREAGRLLDVVERIDPGLVPEVMWRYVAARSTSANPRMTIVYSPSDLIRRVACYDREVAAALFETSRDRIEHTEDRELARWFPEFEAWASFDPRAAVARLERLPVGPELAAYDARIRVARWLGLSHEQQLRTIWPDRDSGGL